MQLLQRIVVGVDGSHSGSEAVELAIRLGKAHEAELIFAYAIDYAAVSENSAAVIEAMTEDGYVVVRKAKKEALDAGVAARSELLEGRPEYALTRFSSEVNADAIVVGAHGAGPSDRYFLGSTTEGVLRLALVPVFVARTHGVRESGTFRRIVVAIDNSDPSDAAIRFATILAVNDGSELIFCHVVDDNTLYEEAANYGGSTYPVLQEWLDEAAILSRTAAEQASGVGLRGVEAAVLRGNPISEILNYAASRNADLIVAGAHGRRGLRHLTIGSVANGIVRRSSIPVLIIRTAPAVTAEHASAMRPHIESHGFVTLRNQTD